MKSDKVMKLIDKDAVVAEIEKRINFNGTLNAYSRLDECYAILSFIDTLEVKEVDLEKELDSMITPELKFHKALPSLFDIAKHFFELGLSVNSKAQKGEEYDRQSTEN